MCLLSFSTVALMIAASPGIMDNGWTGMGKSSLKFFSVGNFQQRTVEFDVDTYKSKAQNPTSVSFGF